ncbi:DUF6221 family protein [Blastococcus sp. PRF04-17]|uniref:DUF6221 family protein n=1 Tax=Blastococcus sp. PRF04-17 TaxID=2933797 RepID=UPI001FF4B1E4|nr:DUF6221 family protein [Blastococcus sp. PRF04-17]UOY02390.1 DUF6221 family protein [Blastococcus sp. PRF04-17]
MDFESGLEPDMQPNLDQFLLDRIAEDKRIATDAALASGREEWTADDLPGTDRPHQVGDHLSRHDPARVLAECSAKRRLVLACRDARPEYRFLGRRPEGLADFPLSPADQHQLAAVTLALLALPYADHAEYQKAWRP